MVSYDIPEDLTSAILSWLPVKSLLRFKCVRKSWYSLIQSPHFILTHCNNQNRRINNHDDDDYNHIILNRFFNNKFYLSLLSLDPFQMITNDLGFHFFRYDDPQVYLTLIGHFNGVVCLFNTWHEDIILWNPASRETKVVPESTIPLLEDSGLGPTQYGFGYDFKNNDYKVIRVVDFPFYGNDGPKVSQFELYTLSTDSWRVVDGLEPLLLYNGTCINGIYCGLKYFLGDCENCHKKFLASYDVSGDDVLFQLTPLPDPDPEIDYHSYDNELLAVNESIGLVRFQFNMERPVYEIFVLNKFGVDGCWSKLYTIGPFSERSYYYPIGFWKSDVLLIQDEELLLWDLISNELKSSIHIGVDKYGVYCCFYKESLNRLHA